MAPIRSGCESLVNCYCLLMIMAIFTISRAQYDGFFGGGYFGFQRPVSAVVDIKGTTNFPGVSGQIHFTQTTTGGPVIVRGTIQGLTPGLHGLHIHQFGNLSDNCNAAGPHFNPYNKDHGGLDDHVRHVGDLGNVDAMGDSFADLFLFDHLISLSPKSDRSVLHRALVVHEKADDLGLGSHADSKKTGNSGSRVACGIITLTPSRIPSYFK
ncbi:superoxide dismutase [Cu-Zn]-like [Daphnia pulex]|uniref:superoxide dismutase [Cu-Zn]-like n=1 Tax=Daphnia pulex TaxID=6669 RepID=UPI001EE0ED8B|nr:superoxide dismutase [Cu-Zn]-like [Daphnia pulex]XP_046643080.1 superoxide dismutase [Cu-Zn]-like [Daphnia pulicaria]